MPEFYIDKSKIEGEGVFTKQAFKYDEIIMEYKGVIVNLSDIPKTDLHGIGDRYVQIGEDKFLGPSNDIDDWLNHSCDPNAGIQIKNGKIFVVAIRSINASEEIVWDYSTTLDLNGAWEMSCHCDSPYCRKLIKDFKTLPTKLQKKYSELGIVPKYIIDRIKLVACTLSKGSPCSLSKLKISIFTKYFFLCPEAHFHIFYIFRNTREINNCRLWPIVS